VTTNGTPPGASDNGSGRAAASADTSAAAGPKKDRRRRVPGGVRGRIAYLVARPFFALAFVIGRVLPASWLLAIGRSASRAVWVLFRGVRANLLANAAHILGPESTSRDRERLGKETLASFATFIIEWVAPKCIARPQGVFDALEGREHFDDAVAQDSGTILITLHMGNYELPSRELAALRQDVTIVNNRERIAFLERLRSRTRRSRHLDEILIDNSPFFAIDVRERLRRGGVVLLAADQIAAHDAERFPFLHGEAPFSLWPARLARSTGAPIVPAFCVRAADGSYRVRLEKPIVTADREPREITAEIVAVLARCLARHPEQWLMVHDFWG